MRSWSFIWCHEQSLFLIKILNILTFKSGFFNGNWNSTFLSCCWTYFSIGQIFYPAMENWANFLLLIHTYQKICGPNMNEVAVECTKTKAKLYKSVSQPGAGQRTKCRKILSKNYLDRILLLNQAAPIKSSMEGVAGPPDTSASRKGQKETHWWPWRQSGRSGNLPAENLADFYRGRRLNPVEDR